MRLYEEFKLYEQLWESNTHETVTVFVGNSRNEESLITKVEKTNPYYMNIVFSVQDVLRAFDLGELTKVYTDVEGIAEIKKVCDNMPARIKDKILSITNLVEACKLKEASNNEKIAFMDFTGSSFQFEDLYKKQMRKDLGRNGTYKEVNTIEDTKMKALGDAVNSGAEVVLYTCDDDYKYNCPSIVGKSNFKVVLVDNKLTETTPKVVNKHSDDIWTVAFKDDPDHPIIMGDKAKCDAFIKNNEATPATKSHGGLVVKQGGQVPVVDESLTEAVAKTAGEIIRRYEDNVADHIVELEHEKAFYDAEWFEDEWYILKDVKVNLDHYILVMDRPVESLQDAEAIINYAFGFINNTDEAFSEGGIVQDEGSNEIYVETWVVE